MITRADLEAALPWQVFRGASEDPCRGTAWALFEYSIGCSAAELVARGWKLAPPGTHALSPQRDDERSWARGRRPDDIDAALAYLRTGGALVFAPDDVASVDEDYSAGEVVDGGYYGRFVAIEAP